MSNLHGKLPCVDADRLATKEWLRELRDARKLSRTDVAEIIGASSETVKNWESPTRSGFSQSLTLIRYLRLLGVLVDAPVQLPGLGRLGSIEAKVATLATEEDVMRGFESIRAAIDALASPGTAEDPPAEQTP